MSISDGLPGITVPWHRHDPPELWFRGSVGDGIRAQRVTATVRAGNRVETHSKGYVIGDRVLMRCLDDADREQFRCWAHIIDVRVRTLSSIIPADLAGCPAEESDRERLRSYLEKQYGRPIARDEPLTIIRFTHESQGISV